MVDRNGLILLLWTDARQTAPEESGLGIIGQSDRDLRIGLFHSRTNREQKRSPLMDTISGLI